MHTRLRMSSMHAHKSTMSTCSRMDVSSRSRSDGPSVRGLPTPLPGPWAGSWLAPKVGWCSW